jgi:hypothetical protein
MGAGRPDPRHAADARLLGRLCAEHGWIVLTGGRDMGVMREASAGAHEVPGSLVVGVLPDDTDAHATDVDVAIVTGLGSARNNVNVLSSTVVVACGVEGAGTASEVALALKALKPVVLLRASAEAAAFYSSLDAHRVHTAMEPHSAIALLRDVLGVPEGGAWR